MEKKIKRINILIRVFVVISIALVVLLKFEIGGTLLAIALAMCFSISGILVGYKQQLLQADEVEYDGRIPTIADLLRWYANCPQEFEKFCAELFMKMGYEAQTTAGSNDGGYDIAMKKDGVDYIAECKLYATDAVGRPLIQKLVGANATQRADKMVFITTSKFSKPAIDYAAAQKVWLIDGNELQRMIDRYY